MLRPAKVAKNALLGAVVVALLGIAVWRFVFRGESDEAAPDTISAAAHFLCTNCKEYFALTPRQIEQAEESGRVGAGGKDAGAGGEPDPTGGRAMAFDCPKCGQRRGIRAEKCPQHGDVIPLFPGSSDPVKCSKCDFRP